MGKDCLTRLDWLTRLWGARYGRAAAVTLLAAAAAGQAIGQAVTLGESGAHGYQSGVLAVQAAEYALPLTCSRCSLRCRSLSTGRP